MSRFVGAIPSTGEGAAAAVRGSLAPMNPLLRDRDVEFLLHEVLDGAALLRLPAFADHDAETVALFLEGARRLAREALFPAYRPMDAEPPRFEGGRVAVHPLMKAIYPRLVDLGVIAAARPVEVGGQRMPLLVTTLASAYLMAANASAYGYAGLTAGAAHLLEAFGDDTLRRRYMAPLYEGRWTGTMALTEPHAGSSLADITTRATPAPDGSYRIVGAKIFISGGDHDLTENIVHMVLARVEGAPAGVKGVSLFCVPKRRLEGDALVENDVSVAGMIHKIGWRGLPSLALSFGERGDCHGFLVGEAHKGLSYMFQMMNEARIMVGVNGVATASAAFHEALAYAEARPQGRALTAKDPASRPVPIVAHADVRRMLLRQKALVEGGLALVARTALYADLAEHAQEPRERERAKLLLDLLTPVAKTFPAERGFEANTLAVQVHGGYGYSSEYLVEAWLRDQKLNTIHEGTTGIQGMDLLGRKVMAAGGAALKELARDVQRTVEASREAGVDTDLGAAVTRALEAVGALTMELGAKGLTGDVEGMLLHSSDYLELFGIFVVAWQHLAMATAAVKTAAAGEDDAAFRRGKVLAATYWIRTELPRLEGLVALCRAGEDSYARVRSGEL
jgi:alkylation response protein AidB-like acyl-CoA dehydrogenase